jgi:hypothetical protein
MPLSDAPFLSAEVPRRLLIDRHSLVLSRLPPRRRAALADASRPEASIWNVFRTLAQIDPARWLPGLLAAGGVRIERGWVDFRAGVAVTHWKKIRPPAERLEWLHRQAIRGQLRPPVGRRRHGRVIPLSELRAELKDRARRRHPLEDPLEVDVILKASGSVFFVEIPAPEETPEETTASDAGRTHLLRLLDVGLAYAESRSRARRQPVGFGLLVLPADPRGAQSWSAALRRISASPARLRRSLPHRDPSFDPSVLAGRAGVAPWRAVEGLVASLRRESTDPLDVSLLERLQRHLSSAGAEAAV